MVKLHERIKRLRKERGLTQEKLAFKSGLSVKQTINMDQGKASPSLRSVAKVAEVLNIELHELFKGVEL